MVYISKKLGWHLLFWSQPMASYQNISGISSLQNLKSFSLKTLNRFVRPVATIIINRSMKLHVKVLTISIHLTKRANQMLYSKASKTNDRWALKNCSMKGAPDGHIKTLKRCDTMDRRCSAGMYKKGVSLLKTRALRSLQVDCKPLFKSFKISSCLRRA